MNNQSDNFVKTKDEFGFSFKCKECGKNQFYVDSPDECEHNPNDSEISMHTNQRKQ